MLVTLKYPEELIITVLDYTGLGLDIEFPNKSGISAVEEDLISFPELDTRPTDEHRTTLDEIQSEIFKTV